MKALEELIGLLILYGFIFGIGLLGFFVVGLFLKGVASLFS